VITAAGYHIASGYISSSYISSDPIASSINNIKNYVITSHPVMYILLTKLKDNVYCDVAAICCAVYGAINTEVPVAGIN